MDTDYGAQQESWPKDITSSVPDGQTTSWAEDASMPSQSVGNFGGNPDEWPNQVSCFFHNFYIQQILGFYESRKYLKVFQLQ